MLKKVTITGADDAISIEALDDFCQEYPFLEWGILHHHQKMGEPRYPGDRWFKKAYRYTLDKPLPFSLHLCGNTVKQLTSGKDSPHIPKFALNCPRIQFNYNGIWTVELPACSQRLGFLKDKQLITQMDGLNDNLYAFYKAVGIDVAPLYDQSKGKGKTPAKWPKPYGTFCGFAGGLNPENIAKELDKILLVAGDIDIWIDMETGVRNEENNLDLEKVKFILDYVKPFTKEKSLLILPTRLQ